MLSVVSRGWLLAALAVSAPAVGAQTGSISGIAVSAEAGSPLGYSVAAVPARHIERFTDDSGRFLLRGLPAGEVRLVVRHIGYVPTELSVTVRDGGTTDVRAVLVHVPVALAAVKVSAAAACTAPGAPTVATDRALAAIFGQLEQNAQQYQLISTQYPFTSVIERRFDYDPAPPLTVFRPDTTPIPSDAPWSYKAGDVVTRRGAIGGYAVRIPTLAVFTDPAFLNAHCFWNAGMTDLDGARALRIDFQAAERIHSPDLNGSLFLDSSSFVIRRSVIRLSRYSREIEDYDSVTVETRFAEAIPGVPVIAEVHGRSHYREPRDVRGLSESASIEHQRVIAMQFAKGVPGRQDAGAAAPPARSRPFVIWLARVLGVFDADTGAPIAGATVRDSTSGRSAVTSATGTLRLSFLPRSSGFLSISKPGYASDTLSVTLSLADTTPITVLLRPVAAATPAATAPAPSGRRIPSLDLPNTDYVIRESRRTPSSPSRDSRGAWRSRTGAPSSPGRR